MFVVAIFSPLAYILVLTALVFTPVSYVAPAREISILIGAVMGARLLSEGDGRWRWDEDSLHIPGLFVALSALPYVTRLEEGDADPGEERREEQHHTDTGPIDPIGNRRPVRGED